jgi:probable F420-dependent oxidoreductase
MKIDGIMQAAPARAARSATDLERSCYDAAWAAEMDHDPFLPLVAAAQVTTKIELGTSIAVAFARNPMTLANIGWDLQAYAQGRFVLGLGSQIKAHIERRYSMPWGQPAARMEEMIKAIRAIWDSWLGHSELEFEGEFFRHTLMPPSSAPDPADLAGLALPRIFVAAVGPLMTRTAARSADGLIFHVFHSVEYLESAVVPGIRSAREAAGMPAGPFELSGPVFVAAGETDATMALAIAGVKERIGFYASTPAYRPVLEAHGWEDVQPRLNVLAKTHQWDRLADLVTEEMLHAFAVVARPEDVADEILRRYDGRVDRVSFSSPYESEPEMWTGIVQDVARCTAAGSAAVARAAR